MLSSHMFGVFVTLTCVSPNFNAIYFFSKNDSNASPLLIVCSHMNPLCHGGMTRPYEECNHGCVYYIIYTTPMSSFFV